jgi:hypothetical protein
VVFVFIVTLLSQSDGLFVCETAGGVNVFLVFFNQ